MEFKHYNVAYLGCSVLPQTSVRWVTEIDTVVGNPAIDILEILTLTTDTQMLYRMTWGGHPIYDLFEYSHNCEHPICLPTLGDAEPLIWVGGWNFYDQQGNRQGTPFEYTPIVEDSGRDPRYIAVFNKLKTNWDNNINCSNYTATNGGLFATFYWYSYVANKVVIRSVSGILDIEILVALNPNTLLDTSMFGQQTPNVEYFLVSNSISLLASGSNNCSDDNDCNNFTPPYLEGNKIESTGTGDFDVIVDF